MRRKSEILNGLKAARTALLAAIDGLTPEQMVIPGAAGIWSVKDVLAHLVAWESELVTALHGAQRGQVPALMKIEDIHGWNDEQYHLNAPRPLEAVLSDLESVHRVLCRMVEEYDERALNDNRRYPWMEGEPLWYLIEEIACLHEQEHAEDIRTWRRQEGI